VPLITCKRCHAPSLTKLFYSHQFTTSRAAAEPGPGRWRSRCSFYILAPALAAGLTIGSARVRRSVNVAGDAGLLAGCVLRTRLFLLSNSLAGRLQEFLAGFLLADLYVTAMAGRPAGIGGTVVAGRVGGHSARRPRGDVLSESSGAGIRSRHGATFRFLLMP